MASVITIASISTNQIVRFGTNLILTRLLVPEMFGVMSICMTIIAAFVMLSDAGLRQYVSWSKDGVDPKVLDTVWMMRIFRSSIITLLMLIVAAILYLASVNGWLGTQSAYSHPLLPLVLAGMAVCPLLKGFESTKRFELGRKLLLGRIEIIDVTALIVGVIAMIVLAYIFDSIWALVLGNILTSFVKLISTHLFLPGHQNSFLWDWEKFHKIFDFSRWILLSSIFGYLVIHADFLWLGALVSASTLGIYSIGKTLALVLHGVIDMLSVSVIQPELNNVAREDHEAIGRTYYKFRVFIDIPVFLVAGMFGVIGPDLIAVLYDPRYLEAGRVFQILSIALIWSSYMQAEICLVPLGLVKKKALIIGAYAIVLNIAIPVCYYLFGFDGVLYAMLASPVAPVICANYFLYKNGILNILFEIRFLPLYFVGMAIGMGIVELLQIFMSNA
ncbi:oligosaccharide flippase family protein [Gammaproteobacteria bacterium]|nr:oligosaccharide flippase family protein [Gammaproteobacteria bacterium]